MSIEHAASHAEVERLITTVPEELQEYRQFVGWDTFQRAGRPTKVPLNPHTGYYASVTDPESWGSIREALSLVATRRAKGIGFTFSSQDPYIGVDLDKCLDGTSIEPWAMEIVTSLSSYTEISPSGTGLHIIAEGDIDAGRRRDGIEIYSEGRFFTLTGNHFPGTPEGILSRQKEIEKLYTSLMPPRITEIFPGASDRLVPLREDDKVLKKAMEAKNSEKFLRLWQGDIADYRSHSEADFELVLLLLYWTGNDTTQTKRLFLQSGLVTDKTLSLRGKSTYLDVTINNALAKRRRR